MKLAKTFFGAGSLWENVPPAPSPPGAQGREIIPRAPGRRPFVIMP